jgi:glycine/D-amino acid oxidase-like deaminating enzyme/nitrite reductase/ring-hydroxylating ferredoxin subunit
MPEHNQPVWYVGETQFQRVAEDMNADVVVVGGGITGATAALRLAEAGKSVILLEGRQICSGVTGHTTAHLTEALDGRYANIADKLGDDAAEVAAQASRAAINHVFLRVNQLGIDCELHTVPGFLYGEQEADRDELVREFDAVRAVGVRAELVRHVELPFPVVLAVQYFDQARFHPQKYVRGLLKGAAERGVRIFEHSHVAAIEDDSVRLDTGRRVTAKAIFCATHTPLTHLQMQAKLLHSQSYVLGYRGRPIGDALFWDSGAPYHYLRLASLRGEELFLVGGADHRTGECDDTRQRFSQLAGYADRRFPVGRPDFRWSAELVEPIDGLPYIGKLPNSKSTFVATGYAGNGMTFGTVAGLLVSDLILGVDNSWRETFEPSRLTLSSVGKLVRENLPLPRHRIAERLRRGEVDVTRAIEPGDGKIMRKNGKRLAVHRDLAGALHVVSAICPHAGCVVHFNRAEQSWDCPCHGSRFTTDGAVLDGPAMTALTKYDKSDTEDR